MRQMRPCFGGVTGVEGPQRFGDLTPLARSRRNARVNAVPLPNTLAPSSAFADELARRRTVFLARLLPGDVAVIAAAPVYIRNNDVEHHHRQDSDFFYLTGYDEPECVAVFSRVEGAKPFTLFVRLRDPERETWDGPRSGVEGAQQDFRADAAFAISELPQRLPACFENARRLHFALGRDPKIDAAVLASRDFVKRRQRLGVLAPNTIIDLSETLHPMRLIKTDFELEEMRRACAATAEAHLVAMQNAYPGKYEHDVEAEMLRVFRKHGSPRPAYEPIVGSGPNATILHYRKNDRLMEEGDLLLIDAGAEIGFMAGDVTRTFPVSGTYTKPQRAIYEAVLEAQLAAIAIVRPGVTIEEIHQVTITSLTTSLVALGLIEGPVQSALEEGRFKKFYMHRTSHWLGMDVHDVGSYFVPIDETSSATRARPLEAGMILTIEPGLYIGVRSEAPAEYLGIGVRIEDDVLVTETGFDVLTKAIPKTVHDVEQVLAARLPRA